MQRCTASIVPTAEVKPSQLEKVDRNRAISLSGHMQHVDPVIVLRVDIGAQADQELASIGVALEGGEVQGCEAVAVVLLVDPLSHLLLSFKL